MWWGARTRSEERRGANRPTVRPLGRPREQPDERDEQRLLRALALPASGLGGLEMIVERERLRALHRDDFREGRTYELAAWIMSRTELRMAATTVG